MKVHQIFINDSKKLPLQMPDYSLICTKQFLKLYSEHEYNLYCGEQIENILATNFDKDVLTSYNILKPYSYKADLAKYCLLYLYGGFYFDLSIFFISQIPCLEDFNFFTFRDKSNNCIKTWALSSGIMYATPKCPIMKTCIEIVIKHCREKFYGVDVSGPAVLAESVVLNYKKMNNHFILGERMNIHEKDMRIIKENFPILKQNMFENINECFVSDLTKDVICLCKPSKPGDIESLGFQGTNNYINLWVKKDVFDENIKFNAPKYFYS